VLTCGTGIEALQAAFEKFGALEILNTDHLPILKWSEEARQVTTASRLARALTETLCADETIKPVRTTA
jgi:hypothetical protein